MINMPEKVRSVPLYTTSGNLGGFLRYPYIFNAQGEWIGWVTAEREVFSVYGKYVGWLDRGFRILRQRTYNYEHAARTPPGRPGKLTPPAQVPLPSMMAEITASTIDVLEERADLMPTEDAFAYSDDGG